MVVNIVKYFREFVKHTEIKKLKFTTSAINIWLYLCIFSMHILNLYYVDI